MATRESAIHNFELFSDEVFTSTDLNRRAGEVLNHARRKPVTIARNNEQFALMKREQAARLIQTVSQLMELRDVFQGAVSVKLGIEPPASVAWMKFLDEDDRMSMLHEVLEEYSRAELSDDSESSMGDLIHEWKESAAVIRSGVLRQTSAEPRDEKPLTSPLSEDAGQ